MSNKYLVKKQTGKWYSQAFFSENLEEESFITKKLEAKVKEKISLKNTFKVIFTGRFDKNRGIHEFLEIAKILKKEKDFRFEIFGFGNLKIKQDIENAILKQDNLHLYYEAGRDVLLKHLVNSNISFNFFKDSTFIQGSFPSKLIELITLTPVILSNFNVEEIASDRMILFNGSVKDAVNKIFLSKKTIIGFIRILSSIRKIKPT